MTGSGRLLDRAGAALWGMAPHARRHRSWLVRGAAAAICVVAVRLALPWPLGAVSERWVGGGLPPGAPAADGVPSVAWMGGVCLGLLLALGLADHLERLWFARFAIGTVRDLRAAAFHSAVRLQERRRSRRTGDVLSRLVADTARIKSGLQGFLIHIATNGITLLGVTAVLVTMDPTLALVFAGAGVATAALTAHVAGRVFRRSLKVRKREGRLADEIQTALHRRKARGFRRLNRSSGRQEASVTRLQGFTTWAAHGIFGLGVSLALWVGSAGVESGRLAPGDIVVVLMYALTMRGPIVRLARQGSRSGKILGPAYRLVRIIEQANRLDAPVRHASLPASGVSGSGSAAGPLRVLFSGYAHVHFLCFRPLYRELQALPGVELFLSGGTRTRTTGGWRYDERALYEPFGIPPDRVLPVGEIAERDFDVLFAANTSLILPRSVRKRIQIFHGISCRNRAVRPANMGCDHYFLVGPYMHRRFTGADLLAERDPRAVRVGFMKTDPLLSGELDRGRLLSQLGLDGRRPVLLYAPTGASANSLETMGEEVIARLASGGQYDVLVKLHDHPKSRRVDWVERLAPLEGPHCRVVRGPDVIPLLFVADLLLSDASSVSNEYALLDRPIVFLDTPELLARARTARDSALDLDTWGRRAGVVVERPDDVEAVVDRCLRHPAELSPVRRAMVEDLFYNPGAATGAALSWLRENLLPTLDARAPGACGEALR